MPEFFSLNPILATPHGGAWKRALVAAKGAGVDPRFLEEAGFLLEEGRHRMLRERMLGYAETEARSERVLEALLGLAITALDGGAAGWLAAKIGSHAYSSELENLLKGQGVDRSDPVPDRRGAVGVPCLTWLAPFCSYSGYARAARYYVEAAEAVGLPVRTLDLHLLDAYWEGLSDEERRRWERRRWRCVDKDLFIISCMPRSKDGRQDYFGEVRLRFPGFKRYVGYTTFETEPLPSGWVESMLGVDEIWVPSEFNRRVFSEALGTRVPVRTLPHGVELLPERVSGPPRELFTFLSVFLCSYHKGFDLLLTAFARAFRGRKDVQLLLHTRGEGVRDLLDKALAETGVPQEDIPSVLVSTECVSDAVMEEIYAGCDCFVLPTRGEGWGLPIMEAMAAGVPVIASACGGTTDFLSEETGWPIPCRFVRRTESLGCMAAGQRWAEPDLERLMEAMRQVHAGGEEVERRRENARRMLRERFSPRAIGERLRDLITARVRHE
jgi:glycosyltransferase involved in cell wall biosynthesis